MKKVFRPVLEEVASRIFRQYQSRMTDNAQEALAATSSRRQIRLALVVVDFVPDPGPPWLLPRRGLQLCRRLSLLSLVPTGADNYLDCLVPARATGVSRPRRTSIPPRSRQAIGARKRNRVRRLGSSRRPQLVSRVVWPP